MDVEFLSTLRVEINGYYVMMTSHLASVVNSRSDRKYVSCIACAAYAIGQCRETSGIVVDSVRARPPVLQPETYTILARRKILSTHDFLETVPFVCQGWAYASANLADGRRQIFSFILPGDIILAPLLFESLPHCSVETITTVQYRNFKRVELQKLLTDHPEMLQPISKIWVGDKLRGDQQAMDLGRCTGHERVARLILNLKERLTARGIAEGDTMEFPLRQAHIADATGLSKVHVTRILSDLVRDGIFVIKERSLTILDSTGLRNAANMW